MGQSWTNGLLPASAETVLSILLISGNRNKERENIISITKTEILIRLTWFQELLSLLWEGTWLLLVVCENKHVAKDLPLLVERIEKYYWEQVGVCSNDRRILTFVQIIVVDIHCSIGYQIFNHFQLTWVNTSKFNERKGIRRYPRQNVGIYQIRQQSSEDSNLRWIWPLHLHGFLLNT